MTTEEQLQVLLKLFARLTTVVEDLANRVKLLEEKVNDEGH